MANAGLRGRSAAMSRSWRSWANSWFLIVFFPIPLPFVPWRLRLDSQLFCVTTHQNIASSIKEKSPIKACVRAPCLNSKEQVRCSPPSVASSLSVVPYGFGYRCQLPLPWCPVGLVTVVRLHPLIPCGFGHCWWTLPLDPYGFGHRCDSTSLGSLLVWSPLLAPLPWFPVGLVTVARLLSLGSLWRWSPLLVPHPLFPMGLVTVTSPPPLVPHGRGQPYQLPFLPHGFFIRLRT